MGDLLDSGVHSSVTSQQVLLQGGKFGWEKAICVRNVEITSQLLQIIIRIGTGWHAGAGVSNPVTTAGQLVSLVCMLQGPGMGKSFF